MLPLKDNVPTRTFPLLTIALILANGLAFVLYQDAGQGAGFEAAVNEGAYQPCEVERSCPSGQIGWDWTTNVWTSMFMHGDWGHLLGNMLFLWIFGNNVEDALGKLRFIVFYLLGGLAATALQTVVTLGWSSDADAAIPNLGASGAVAAILGAYLLLHPGSSVLTWIAPIFFVPIPALLYLGLWFLFQAVEGGLSFTHPEQGGGVAYWAHIGGFVFGFLAIKLFQAGRPRPLRVSY